MKKLLLVLLTLPVLGIAQVPKKIIVEHFTNTKCGICASLNPGFYTNLNSQQGDIVHIAYHPSSPYSACLFSQQNQPENDARTNYYNVYGSTPKILIDGTLIQVNNNYNSPAIFDPFESQTSLLNINLSQSRIEDSIEVRVAVKRVAGGAIPALLLYGGLAEDTVFYTGSNGEGRHYDVFRKATFGTNGTTFSAPESVGDSLEIVKRVAVSPLWNVDRLYAYALVQEIGNRKVVQSHALAAGIPAVTSIGKTTEPRFEIYPNPVDAYFTVHTENAGTIEVKIVDTKGRVINQMQTTSGRKISTSFLQPGMYLALVTVDGKTNVRKIIK